MDNGIDDPLGETVVDEYGQRWSPVVRDYTITIGKILHNINNVIFVFNITIGTNYFRFFYEVNHFFSRLLH